jgi:hypothetical protein
MRDASQRRLAAALLVAPANSPYAGRARVERLARCTLVAAQRRLGLGTEMARA